MANEATAGDVYVELVTAQLEEERERKGSIEQRGIAVITTSGAIVSLLAALAALVLSEQDQKLGAGPLPAALVAVAMVFFVFAVVLGLHANAVRDYLEADPDDLKRLTSEEYWSGRAGIASMRVTQLRIEMLEVARGENRAKALYLKRAMQAEIAAIVALAGAVLAVILGL